VEVWYKRIDLGWILRQGTDEQNIVTLTNTNFDDEVKKRRARSWSTSGPSGAAPAGWLAPVLEKLADEYAGKARIGKVNVDEQGNLARSSACKSIPTLLLFKTPGRGAIIGATTKDVLAKLIDKHVS